MGLFTVFSRVNLSTRFCLSWNILDPRFEFKFSSSIWTSLGVHIFVPRFSRSETNKQTHTHTHTHIYIWSLAMRIKPTPNANISPFYTMILGRENQMLQSYKWVKAIQHGSISLTSCKKVHTQSELHSPKCLQNMLKKDSSCGFFSLQVKHYYYTSSLYKQHANISVHHT